MDIDLHNVKEIIRGRIVKRTRDNGDDFFTMRITFVYDELGTCKERYSNNTMWGDTEVSSTITLYADTKEALKLSYKALR